MHGKFTAEVFTGFGIADELETGKLVFDRLADRGIEGELMACNFSIDWFTE